jgi:hypothetical protein
VTAHRIAYAVLVALIAFLTWFVKPGRDEPKAEKVRMRPRDLDPVGFS